MLRRCRRQRPLRFFVSHCYPQSVLLHYRAISYRQPKARKTPPRIISEYGLALFPCFWAVEQSRCSLVGLMADGETLLMVDAIGSYHHWVIAGFMDHPPRFFAPHYYPPSVLLQYVCLIAIYHLVTDPLSGRSPDRFESATSGIECRPVSVYRLASTCLSVCHLEPARRLETGVPLSCGVRVLSDVCLSSGIRLLPRIHLLHPSNRSIITDARHLKQHEVSPVSRVSPAILTNPRIHINGDPHKPILVPTFRN